MKNFKKGKSDSKTWGVLGKQQTFYAPTHFMGEKVPLNANPLDSWDYKKSKYRRIDLVPKNDGQQAGTVIGQIKWSSRMRGYAFLPEKDHDDEIKTFIKDLMSKRKSKKD
jgi:hypothetical protein